MRTKRHLRPTFLSEPLAGWSIALSDYDHERERHYHLRLSFDALTIEIERHLVINPDYLAAGADVPPEKVLESRYGFRSADAFDRFLSAFVRLLFRSLRRRWKHTVARDTR